MLEHGDIKFGNPFVVDNQNIEGLFFLQFDQQVERIDKIERARRTDENALAPTRIDSWRALRA